MTNQELANVFEEYERFSKELSDKPMVTFKDNFMMVKKHEDFFKSVYKIGYIQGYKDQS